MIEHKEGDSDSGYITRLSQSASAAIVLSPMALSYNPASNPPPMAVQKHDEKVTSNGLTSRLSFSPWFWLPAESLELSSLTANGVRLGNK